MTLLRLHLSIVMLSLVAALAAACGGGVGASLSPTSPSATSGGATISGQVNGATSVAPLATGSFQALDTHGVTITVVGTGISTTADGRGQFTLTNVPAGTVQLNFSGPGANATITIAGVGPNDQVQITVTVNGGSARVDSEHHSAPDNNGEFTGRIASINAAALSFQAADTTVTVSTSTTIRHGSQVLQFMNLKVGDQVEVRGTRTGATIAATEIKVEDVTGDDHSTSDK